MRLPDRLVIAGSGERGSFAMIRHFVPSAILLTVARAVGCGQPHLRALDAGREENPAGLAIHVDAAGSLSFSLADLR